MIGGGPRTARRIAGEGTGVPETGRNEATSGWIGLLGRSSRPARRIPRVPEAENAWKVAFSGHTLTEGKPYGECQTNNLGGALSGGSPMSCSKSRFFVLVAATLAACSSPYMEKIYSIDPTFEDGATLTWGGPTTGNPQERLFQAYLIDGKTVRCGDYYCSDEMRAKLSAIISPGLHCVCLKSGPILPNMKHYAINFPMRFAPNGRYHIELAPPERSVIVTDQTGMPVFEATFMTHWFDGEDQSLELTHHQSEFASHQIQSYSKALRANALIEANSLMPSCPILLFHGRGSLRHSRQTISVCEDAHS